MDRPVMCLTLLTVLLCCCVHGTARKTRVQQKQEEGLEGWTLWSAWSGCTKTCGGGLMNRIRKWQYPPTENNPEPFTNTDSIGCMSTPCPVNGSWSEWGIWGECSAPCGAGQQESVRNCDAPPPQNGGANCTGVASKKKPCLEDPCPPTPACFDMAQCVKRTNFTCTNQRMCVPQKQRCDGAVQCSDGSDEKGCRRSTRYKIGRVHFSNSSPRHSLSSVVAVLSLLGSAWVVRLLSQGQRHTVNLSSPGL